MPKLLGMGNCGFSFSTILPFHGTLGLYFKIATTYFKFNCYLDYTKPKERYSCDKADFQAMRSHLVETKREEEFLGTANAKNCEDLWISLKSKK